MKRGCEELEEEEPGTAAARPDEAEGSEANAPAAVRARLEPPAAALEPEASAAASEPAAAAASAGKTVLDLPDEILGKIFGRVGRQEALFGACLWRVCKLFDGVLKSPNVVWSESELAVECSVEERSETADSAATLRGPLARVASAARRGLLAGVRRLVLRFDARAPFLGGTQAGADLSDLLRELRAGGGLARVEHLALEERRSEEFREFSILALIVIISLSALFRAPGVKSLAILASGTDDESELPPPRQLRSLLMGLPSLESLFFDGVRPNEEHAAAIAEAVPALRRLRAFASSASSLRALAGCPRLEEVRLTGDNLESWRPRVVPAEGLPALQRLALNAEGIDLSGIDELEALTCLELRVTGSTRGFEALLPLAPRLRELRLVLGWGACLHLEALTPVVAALPASAELHVAFARDSNFAPGEDLARLIRVCRRTLRSWEDSEDFESGEKTCTSSAEAAAALAACGRLEWATLNLRGCRVGRATLLEALGPLAGPAFGARLRVVASGRTRPWFEHNLPHATLVEAEDDGGESEGGEDESEGGGGFPFLAAQLPTPPLLASGESDDGSSEDEAHPFPPSPFSSSFISARPPSPYSFSSFSLPPPARAPTPDFPISPFSLPPPFEFEERPLTFEAASPPGNAPRAPRARSAAPAKCDGRAAGGAGPSGAGDDDAGPPVPAAAVPEGDGDGAPNLQDLPEDLP